MKEPEINARTEVRFSRRWLSRRGFVRGASLIAGGTLVRERLGWGQMGAMLPSPAADRKADYTLEIAEVEWEIGAKKKIRTVAYNGQIPGPLLRVTEGRPVAIEIVNKLDREEIVHWHGQWIPSDVDGAMEEGSPMVPAGERQRITFSPRPAGLHWYHTHAMAKNDLKRGLFTGQFGFLVVEPAAPAAAPYDREQFVVLHDWDPFYMASDDGSMMVSYGSASVNGKMLGQDEPLQVREGQRVLFQILNASATEVHWLTLPGHKFRVMAMDGAAVATQAAVDLLRLGPGERITALVKMDAPGVWVLGEARKSFRDAGMGMVVEYAGRAEKAKEPGVMKLKWDYRAFGDAIARAQKPDVTITMVFTSRFRGHGALDEWLINGKSYPETPPIMLREGLRHRLVFDNRSTDDHPVHMHRHNFELVSINGESTSGVHKDVVVVEGKTKVEVDLVAANRGDTLFHCHQQDHMDSGFMNLFRYAAG